MRNLGLIVALWLAAILPTGAFALGLGEIEVKSFLNQPLEAEIEVISARPGEIDDLLVSLASREAFTRAGLSRPRHLSDLRFSVRKNEEADEAVIVVTTKDGVKEPFLNFLIEADWAKGRVLREFTILLDPPFYAEQPPPVESASQETVAPISDDSSVSEIAEQAGVTPTPIAEPEQSADSGQQFSEPIALSQEDAAADPPVPAPEAMTEPEPIAETSSFQYAPETSRQNFSGEVLVNKGDTLWSIAGRYQDAGHSMSQIMLAFQRANPGAFNDGNINNMREGAILRVPDVAELNAMGKQEAYAEVLVQNGLWDEYVARVTGVSPAAAVDRGDATSSATAGSAADSGDGELSLLLPADGSGESAGTGDAAEVSQLRNKLAMAEEELEASRIENRELESRISELQVRLSKLEELQKMVQIEDDSLTQLQENAAADKQAAEPAASGTVGESAAVEPSEQALIEELLAEEAAAQVEEQASQQSGTDSMVDDEASNSMANDGAASDTMGDNLSGADAAGNNQMAMNEGETQQNPKVTSPAPVIITETAREPSMFDGILPPDVIDMIPSLPTDLPLPSLGGMFSDPLILGALGGVVLLLLALLLYRRKKNETESGSTITASNEEDLFDDDDDDELTPIHLADVDTPDDSEIGVFEEEDDLSVPETQQTLTSTASLSEADVEAEQDDFAATAIISAADMPEMEAPPASQQALAEQDDVLNEVDVYLAYGLYDNAEELLNSNLAETPDRADYRSKLLDTYFATKNSEAFVKEAENLKSMGAAASPYWDRVQIMGFELAPDNPLFSDARDSDLSAADLEISKPQEADFDLGATAEDPSFSTTDFNLGEDDTGSQLDEDDDLQLDADDDLQLDADDDLQLDADDQAATQVIQQIDDLPDLSDDDDVAATQVIRQVGEMPELSDDDDTNLNQQSAGGEDFGLELPDDIGDELEFSMDDDTGGDSGDDAEDLEMSMDFDIDDNKVDEDPSDFDLGDDLGLSLDDDDAADDLGLSLDDDDKDDAGIDLEMDDDDTGGDDFLDATAVVDVGFDPSELDISDEDDAEDDLGLGMEDTRAMDLDDSSLGSEDFDAPIDDTDDDEDISILDFGGEDFEEPTALADSIDDLDDDSLSIDVDLEDDEEDEIKTGTFSPGDFDEPTELADSAGDLDDIDDLMLPDDVDEVSTKLDLARAFIDMGDTEGARGSLEEVIAEGNDAQKEEAQALLDQI